MLPPVNPRLGILMIKLLLLAMVLMSASVQADTYDSIAIRGKLITTGDSVEKLRDIAGDPISVGQNTNSRGNVTSESWNYKINSKYVSFQVARGKVFAIDESR